MKIIPRGMRKIFLIFQASCFCLLAHGQGALSGKVFAPDSTVLDAATVCLLLQKDSSVTQRTLTDASGAYRFAAVPKGSYLVRASVMGRSSAMKKVMIWDGAHAEANLVVGGSISLQEVKVISTGVTIRGDTTTYAVSRFTSGSERNLKDVLGKLPNVSVDRESNSVTANGKHVNRVLLEGQDLFQGNVSIPLDNISADGVRTVDVIDNYSEYDIYDGFRTTNETVLNVGVDEKTKNRVKGELEGYGGVMNKYDARATALYIGRKSMLSAILASNNTGKRLLTFQDILQFSGGLGNLLSGDNPMEEFTKKMDAYAAFTNSRRDIKRRENNMASLSYIANPSEKVKVSVNAIYGYDHYRSSEEGHYDYASGYSYDKITTDKCRQHNGQLSVKLVYMPAKSLNVIYTGNMIMAIQDKKSGNLLDEDSIYYSTKPKTLYLKNNLLLVKRLGKHLLNLSVDYALRQHKEYSALRSSYAAPNSPLGLSRYDTDYDNSDHTYTAQLFYLHRLSDTYYLRFALRGELDKQRFITNGDLTAYSSEYDNYAHIDYTNYYGEVMGGKDKGNFTFSLRLRYAYHHASTNLERDFRRTGQGLLSPMAQVKCQFSPYHFLMVNYEYGLRQNAITDLIDGLWLRSYDQQVTSQVDKFFFAAHKATLSHFLSLPYAGLNFLNMISYEAQKDPVVTAYTQNGYLNQEEKRLGADCKQVTLMSSAEYKFLYLPLNFRCRFSLVHSALPMYYGQTLYDGKSDQLQLQLQLLTFYKKGFNGDLSWHYTTQVYKHVPMGNRLTTHDLSGLLSWQNDKLFASVDARLSTYRLGQMAANNMYYGVEVRYQLTKNLMLRLRGEDVAHLRERRQMTGSVTSYYTQNSLTWYMPGHIVVGVSLKY